MTSEFFRQPLAWLDGALEILFPRECLVCTRPLRGHSLCFRCYPSCGIGTDNRCQRCFNDLSEPATGICTTCLSFPLETNKLRFLWDYSDVPRDFIRTMKYRPSNTLARLGGNLIGKALPSLFDDPSWDLIVTIPSSPSTLRKRLFHPCHEIARGLVESSTRFKIAPALVHASRRNPQASLSHQDRLKGLQKMFRVCRPGSIQGRRILLVEDVITTGATIAAASHVLLSCGALSVDAVALAQARVWSRFRARLHQAFSPLSRQLEQ
jgi:predicted amidophosphoribosyltransferase